MSIPAALEALSSLLKDRLVRSKSDLDLHGRSETHFAPCPPDAVAYPQTTEEVAALMRICTEQGCPVVGWGAGTSLEAQALAIRGGVVVDFARMNKVLEIRPEDMDCTVQPGITREALNVDLRATGLFFPVDPGANASIGGMAMTRASGTTAVRYGTMRDNVLGLEAVLADGRVIRTGTRARKSSAGYDLTGLLVGSEGTLGLITELTLRLQGQPEAVSSGVCAFDRIEDAVAAVMETIQMGIPMARIEFVDAAAAAAFNAYAGDTLPECPHLMIEFHGSDAGVAEQARRFGEIADEHNGKGFRWSSLEEDRRALWAMRHNGYYAILASKRGAQALVTDICVPISRLAQAVEETRADIAASIIPGPILGHVGDGNFHAILLVDPERPEELDEAKRLSHRMVERALTLGGTATGEHGVGVGKLDYMAREHGQAWDVMGEIKRALDPQGILNPGKLVRGN
ncbi:FAD-linked oxidase C-terminal domain-containing protein [Mesobacterium sp. TK19101]|uniref:D-lactate dehydrogenase (cytochrome) n=1 Tax=Mesobacterium hydrothermale TaxID=3111907 RepID=A0ABU6HHK8_9RHOB|nr:FAD-linked oxidase C-terminal domain-containing protein [Mesobacterium sp. TK19101]MEC3861947.1 FAD-linked oxidase C-terminal domain-containing protein [Mesobacterium sp. TK19101]